MTYETKNQLRTILTSAYQSYEKGLHTYSFFKVHNRALSKDLV